LATPTGFEPVLPA